MGEFRRKIITPTRQIALALWVQSTKSWCRNRRDRHLNSCSVHALQGGFETPRRNPSSRPLRADGMLTNSLHIVSGQDVLVHINQRTVGHRFILDFQIVHASLSHSTGRFDQGTVLVSIIFDGVRIITGV